MPFTRIELVVLTVIDGRLAVLLGRRAEAPQKGKWALPGGVLRIDLDRDLEAAAQRVADGAAAVRAVPAPAARDRRAAARSAGAVGTVDRLPRAAADRGVHALPGQAARGAGSGGRPTRRRPIRGSRSITPT